MHLLSYSRLVGGACSDFIRCVDIIPIFGLISTQRTHNYNVKDKDYVKDLVRKLELNFTLVTGFNVQYCTLF